MEDKRRDTGIPPAAAFDVATPSKQSDSPASGTPSSRRRGGGLKRKASLLSSGGGGSTPQSISSKRQAREKLLSVPFLPIHNGPCTRARQQPNNATTPAMSPNSAAAVKSEAEAVELREAAAGEAVKAADELKVAKEDWEALEAKIEAEFEAIKSRGDNAHVVPIHCGWFSWTKTHPLEEQTLPSFFNGKSEKRTPEIYMEIRNSIMKKFHTNPNTQIELQDLSELTVGELDARQEVMEFLDYWGLINYHPLLQADSADSGDVDNVEAKTDPLIEKLYRFGAELLPEPSVPKSNVARHAVPHGSFPESAIAEELAKSEGPSVEYHCNSCSADCSRKRYHCQKQADFDLCSECFNNGKFGSNMSPSDFILMEPGEAGGVSGGKWTDQENLLLLEALELYNENWNEIAEHVATKTRSQCILHFIQMSIEDTFVDREENTEPVSTNNESINPKDVTEPTTDSKDGVTENHDESMPSPMEIGESGGGNEEKVSEGSGEDFVVRALKDAFEATISFPSYEDKLSFAEAGNPVMALAAFLVRLVEPNVATASARCSLKSVSAANSSGAQLAARHCFLLEDPPDDTKPAGSDRAAIDMVEKEPEKNEKQNDENQKTTDSLSLPQTDNLSTDHSEGKNKDSTPEEKELSASPKSHDPKEEESVASRDEVKNESENRDLPKEDPSITEGLDEVTPKVERPPCSSNEPGDGGLPAGTSSTEVPKDDDEDMVSGSAPESKETNPRISSDLTAENEGKTGKEEAKCSNEKKDHVVVANEELKIDKVKHAAVTAISAAAVKAKLLANKEEEEIRQLATLLIEKQLHKLETKLTFFNEMEGVVMRVREHLERSKQKLYHERAQIIAARLGISSSSSAAAATPSSSRPTTQPSLPTTKAAMTFMNPALRPPSGMMVPQRPPLSRPPMTTTSSSPGSGPFAPPAAPGSSMQPMK